MSTQRRLSRALLFLFPILLAIVMALSATSVMAQKGAGKQQGPPPEKLTPTATATERVDPTATSTKVLPTKEPTSTPIPPTSTPTSMPTKTVVPPTNTPVPPTNTPMPTATTPAGGEGCTPGYWKQRHHFDSWVGYAPADLFDAVFGVTSSFGADHTLLDAVSAGGGGERAMGRHAVAALLNASGEVSYAYSVSDVISMVQQAYAGGSFEATKNLFEAQNEKGCPLN